GSGCSRWRQREASLLWGELHRRAIAYAGNAEEERLWLAGFRMRIICQDCRQHWDAMMQRTPADLSGADAYFAWTVDRHNEVNARLDNAVMAVDAARERWIASG
ncbi:MAG TPA: ERV1/ALR-related protein, partial [Verrucomicrobiae bacterium]|nr:ERV1/ALR-related protein [Verrucomicrobiae bacterium]